jgi:CBS domain containing-hemolysin-like protein
VDARVDLDELAEIVGVDFPEESYETLGGFLFDRLGRIPSQGEVLDYENIEIEIKDANDRRILKTLIRRVEDEGDERDDESGGE